MSFLLLIALHRHYALLDVGLVRCRRHNGTRARRGASRWLPGHLACHLGLRVRIMGKALLWPGAHERRWFRPTRAAAGRVREVERRPCADEREQARHVGADDRRAQLHLRPEGELQVADFAQDWVVVNPLESDALGQTGQCCSEAEEAKGIDNHQSDCDSAHVSMPSTMANET